MLVGDVVAMMGQDGRGGPPDAVAFSADGASYRWVYVPALGNPLISNLQVKTGEKGNTVVVYPALDMANPETVKRWEGVVPNSLVEVEVNDGRGAPADESFVGTRMKRLDGTREYPLVVAQVIAASRDRYAARVKGMQKEIDAALDEEGKAALKDAKPTGPRETAELFYVTWLTGPERLRVCFRTTITDGAYQYGRGVELNPVDPLPLPPKPPKGGLKDAPASGASPRLPPPGAGVRFGKMYGVEFGTAYEMSKTGKLVRVETLPIQGFHRELPPPPAPFGGPTDPRRVP